MKQISLKGLVVAAMLASSLFITAPQALAEGPQPSVVTVTGYAQQEVAPDTAYITIGTSSTAADAQQARTQNNQVMTNVTNAIKAMGIPADNLKTTGFYMSPNYDVKGAKVVLSSLFIPKRSHPCSSGRSIMISWILLIGWKSRRSNSTPFKANSLLEP